MAVNFDAFLRWAEDRFGDVQVKGNEVKLNSIFTEDRKHHLWCNPYGGKHNREDGCYRCFYTDRKGTLVGLVMLIDGCTYEEARDILSGETPIGILEQKLEEFFQEKDGLSPEKKEIKLELPAHTDLIANLPENSWQRIRVEDYLASRKLPSDKLMFCSLGEFRHRIVIPYYDKGGKLIYFNTRNIGEGGLRYRGPSKEVGVGKAEVLYAPAWPRPESKIYLTEGEFDALTLFYCGLNGIACGGKTLDDKQIQMIKDYEICIALDQDPAGFSATITMGNKLINNQIKNLSFVRPPKGIKDWNKMLVAFKPEIVTGWIVLHEKPFDEWTENYLEIIT
jgi:DNA primase